MVLNPESTISEGIFSGFFFFLVYLFFGCFFFFVPPLFPGAGVLLIRHLKGNTWSKRRKEWVGTLEGESLCSLASLGAFSRLPETLRVHFFVFTGIKLHSAF